VKSGTGTKAQLEDYEVAGKTGTAQKLGPEGYSHDRHFASFVGFLPADEPQLCIGVFMDEPRAGGQYGGETSAPVFRSIARQAAAYLGLPPTPGRETPGDRLAQQSAGSQIPAKL
jgi:cell division protein FtsI/penicillin-binding protein 2